MNEKLKKCLLIFFVVQCVIICFTLIGCQSKNPDKPSYWYGTYDMGVVGEDLAIRIYVESTISFMGVVKNIDETGVDYCWSYGEELRHADPFWDEDTYAVLLSTWQELQSRKLIIKRSAIRVEGHQYDYDFVPRDLTHDVYYSRFVLPCGHELIKERTIRTVLGQEKRFVDYYVQIQSDVGLIELTSGYLEH